MLSRILVLIVIFSLFPADLLAQEEEPQFTQLEQGEPAPFAGTLFNPTATAQLIADREFRLTDCDLRVNYEINLLTARRDLEYNLLQVRYDSLEERSHALSNLRDQEIADLQEMVRKHPNRHSHWFFAGGFIVGAATSIAIFFAAREINQGSQ
mgnify:CR=1 FL=1|jgi:hypothetical protein